MQTPGTCRGGAFLESGPPDPLVEVVKSDYTSEEVMQATITLLKRVGKKPIYCKKDVPGFVANRLQDTHVALKPSIWSKMGLPTLRLWDDACKYGHGGCVAGNGADGQTPTSSASS